MRMKRPLLGLTLLGIALLVSASLLLLVLDAGDASSDPEPPPASGPGAVGAGDPGDTDEEGDDGDPDGSSQEEGRDGEQRLGDLDAQGPHHPSDIGPVPELDDEVVAALEERIADAAPLEDVSVAVAGPDGVTQMTYQADEPRVPASTVKLLTAARALEVFDADHRFTTEVHATGPVEDGVVEGDLVLVGGGDPVLGEPWQDDANPQRPRTPLEDLTAELADDIDVVEGAVLADARILPHEPEPEGWRQRYLDRGHAGYSSGLTINAGRELFERGEQLVGAPADDPALEAATVLIELLEEEDVEVADDEPAHVDDGLALEGSALAELDSPPLEELLVYAVQESDNHLADGLWRLAAAEEGEGTWDSAEALTRSALARRGIDPTGARLPDGSGLSRDARLTARQLVRLDAIERAGPDGGLWTELMAVAGESGTLRRRLTGTEAEGLLRGKTGTLRDARSLTAHVQGPTGRWHLAVMADELDGEALGEALPLIDDLALILTRDLLGCDLEGCNEDEDVPTSGHDHVS